jgi:leucine dehydrogenase
VYDSVLKRGFEQVQVLQDPGRGILIFLAIHSTRLGPAFGGVRRRSYATPWEGLEDALRLAEAMTWKCAAAGIRGGGGKAVIVDPGPDRESAYRFLARHIQQMGGRFHTGGDVGTGPAELEIMAAETEFVARPGPDGPGELSQSTARGVMAGMEAVAQRLGHADLSGVVVCVQGLGAVGWRLTSLLASAGSRTLVADLDAERVGRAVQEFNCKPVPCAEALATPCDILAPCALGEILDDESIPRLQAKAVAGAANNVLCTPENGEQLYRRGILHAPDFVINAGGLIHGASYFLEGKVPPEARVLEIGQTVGHILDESKSQGLPPERIALQIARDRVAAAPTDPYFPKR